ncbi:MAG: hypothetical protein PVJ57_13280 [Phycisphaerae bacterium]|jgi:hypothetical protein
MSAAASRQKLAHVAIAVVAVAAAGAVLWSTVRDGATSDFPEGHIYICRDCGATTLLSEHELLEIKAAAREAPTLEPAAVPCSQCGSKNTVPGVRCPACGHCFERPKGRPTCPKCGQAFPRPTGAG